MGQTEKVETQSEEARVINCELANLFKLLSKTDALKIFYRTEIGIENSTYTMGELDLTPKKYYNRLRELVKTGLIRKKDGVYRQTGLGRMVCDRFLPAMGKAVDSKDELDFLAGLKGVEMDARVRKCILEELKIPTFSDSSNVMIFDYESMVVDVIDILNNAEESILLASNYLDVRVMDATTRSMDRGVTNRAIIGKEILSSRLKQLRMMFSPKFTMTIMKLVSNSVDMDEIAKIIDLPYSFCVVDGYINIIEISNALNTSFIAAFHVKNRGLGKKLTDYFETLWKAGESHATISFLNSFKA